jgi:hypothetical protein
VAAREGFAMFKLRRYWLLVLGLFSLGIQIFDPDRVRGQEPDSILFHDDYKRAIREAKLAGKPIFLEFRCAP